MRGVSEAMAAALKTSHTAAVRCKVIRDGQVVRVLDVHAGSVTQDAQASQRTTIEIEVADPDGELTPEGMESLLAPFGTRLQVERGVRLENVEFRVAENNAGTGWAVSDQAPGVLNGLKDDGSGALVIG